MDSDGVVQPCVLDARTKSFVHIAAVVEYALAVFLKPRSVGDGIRRRPSTFASSGRAVGACGHDGVFYRRYSADMAHSSARSFGTGVGKTPKYICCWAPVIVGAAGLYVSLCGVVRDHNWRGFLWVAVQDSKANIQL